MEITDNTKGVILKSPNNTRYRLTVSNSGLPIFTALLLFLLVSLAPAQNVGMATDTNGTILTDRTNAITFTNPVAWNNSTNAATTISNLFASNSLPSGAATAGAVWQADGAGGSVASTTISPTNITMLGLGTLSMTNTNGATVLRASSSLGVRVQFLAGYISGNENVPYVGFGTLGWDTGAPGGNSGAILFAAGNGGSLSMRFGQDGPNSLGMRGNANHAALQSIRIYGRFTNGSNYSRITVGADTNGVAFIRPEAAGAANTNNFLHISGLPTNDPTISGVLWNSNGTVVVSP